MPREMKANELRPGTIIAIETGGRHRRWVPCKIVESKEAPPLYKGEKPMVEFAVKDIMSGKVFTTVPYRAEHKIRLG